MLESIKQAVADGKMTQDKADWLIIGLDKGYLDGPGFGFRTRDGSRWATPAARTCS